LKKTTSIGNGWYCIRCPECGKWQNCEVRKGAINYTFRCRACNRSSKLHQQTMRGMHLHMFGPVNEREAMREVKKRNAERGVAGFATYKP